MRIHRKPTVEEVKAYLDRAMANPDLPLPDLLFDIDDLEFVEDVLLPEPAFRPFSAATSGEAPLPLSGTKPITIRVSNRVINAFKVQADKTGTCYQTLINRTLNAAAVRFS